jgi:hypothetical protein
MRVRLSKFPEHTLWLAILGAHALEFIDKMLMCRAVDRMVHDFRRRGLM